MTGALANGHRSQRPAQRGPAPAQLLREAADAAAIGWSGRLYPQAAERAVVHLRLTIRMLCAVVADAATMSEHDVLLDGMRCLLMAWRCSAGDETGTGQDAEANGIGEAGNVLIAAARYLAAAWFDDSLGACSPAELAALGSAVQAVARAAQALARNARPHPSERLNMASTWLDMAAACLASDTDVAQGQPSGCGAGTDCVAPTSRACTDRTNRRRRRAAPRPLRNLARSGLPRRTGNQRSSPASAAPAQQRRRGLSVPVFTATAMINIIALLSACSGTSQLQVAQAARSSPAVSAESSPAVESQVIAAYTGYFPVLQEAEPLPGDRAARLLAPFAAQPYLSQVLEQMTRARTEGEVAWGSVAPHVTSVEINGGHAVVRDCQDAHAAWLVSSATGQAIPGSTGSTHTYLIAALARGTDDRWRLTWLAHAAGPCSPVPSPP
jgi:hypothetical protein